MRWLPALLLLAGCAKSRAVVQPTGPLPPMCPSSAEHTALGLPGTDLYAALIDAKMPETDFDDTVEELLTAMPVRLSTYTEALPDSAAAKWSIACVSATYVTLASGITPPAQYTGELREEFEAVVANVLTPILDRVRDKAHKAAVDAAAARQPWSDRARRLAESL